MDYRKLFLSKDPSVNLHYLNRYLKLVNILESVDSSQRENHHILPRAMFPEYVETKENIISIPTRWHYILHWILFKIFNHGLYKSQMIFAFNNMKRIIQSDNKRSSLYEMSRKYVSEAVSKSNTGRKKSVENKQAIGRRTKNTVIVKDSDENRFRVSKDDPRYLSGELVFYRTGTKHSKKTIENLKNNNGIRGKTPCYDSEGNIKYFFEDEIPEGFSKEMPKTQREKLSISKRGLLWYNNGVKNIRIKEGKEVPEGFVRGRLPSGNFIGWNEVNLKRREKHEAD